MLVSIGCVKYRGWPKCGCVFKALRMSWGKYLKYINHESYFPHKKICFFNQAVLNQTYGRKGGVSGTGPLGCAGTHLKDNDPPNFRAREWGGGVSCRTEESSRLTHFRVANTAGLELKCKVIVYQCAFEQWFLMGCVFRRELKMIPRFVELPHWVTEEYSHLVLTLIPVKLVYLRCFIPFSMHSKYCITCLL